MGRCKRILSKKWDSFVGVLKGQKGGSIRGCHSHRYCAPHCRGAVQVAMEELPLTLHSARVLILGFGRVGKLTAHRMGALGAKVTVCAQGYADLAWAAAYGHETMWLEKLGGELGAMTSSSTPSPPRCWTGGGWHGCTRAFLLDLASAPAGWTRRRPRSWACGSSRHRGCRAAPRR